MSAWPPRYTKMCGEVGRQDVRKVCVCGGGRLAKIQPRYKAAKIHKVVVFVCGGGGRTQTSNLVFKSGSGLLTDLISRTVALMYADNLALLADLPDDIVVLLGMVSAIALKHRLFINAAKTEVMLVGQPMTLPTLPSSLAKSSWSLTV
eukprot:357652-Chlamydomonas_euryale.AAC.1